MLKVLVTQVWNHSRSAFQKRIEYCIRGKAVTNWVMQKNLSFVYVCEHQCAAPHPPPPPSACSFMCFLWSVTLVSRKHKDDACTRRGSYRGWFSWCLVISRLYFPWNVNLEHYSSCLVTWRFYVTREEPEFSSDIRDFTSLFYVILRRKSSQWLESWIQSDLGMWFAILSHSRYCLLQTLFLV